MVCFYDCLHSQAGGQIGGLRQRIDQDLVVLFGRDTYPKTSTKKWELYTIVTKPPTSQWG